MRLCGLTKHSTQVLRCRYLGTVTLLIMVRGTPAASLTEDTDSPPLAGLALKDFVGWCRLLRMPRLLPGTCFRLLCSVTPVLDPAVEAQRGQVVHKGHAGA